MHQDLQELVRRHQVGRTTLDQCIQSFVLEFEHSYAADDVASVSTAIPDEILTAIKDNVEGAPQSMEEWARFRFMRGVGVFEAAEDAAAAYYEVELSFADSQAHYYRFVTAWRRFFEGTAPSAS